MKVRATVSFASSKICMGFNQVLDVPEDVAAPLLECGYLVPEGEEPDPETETKPEERPKKGKKSESEE